MLMEFTHITQTLFSLLLTWKTKKRFIRRNPGYSALLTPHLPPIKKGGKREKTFYANISHLYIDGNPLQ